MDKVKPLLDLFSADMIRRMRVYAPPEDKPDREKTISGRLLEEVVELHLESGGTPTSAMAHVMDAITNEAFKIRKKFSNNQDAYPSNFEPSYNEEGIEEELGDTLFVWIVAMLTNNVDMHDILSAIQGKLKKLEKHE